ncbi:MAG: CBS domain-containing protein [Chloroflexi bacterium]|nr:CBS domain-containing protein [Chloroflexota bacterium]
MAQSVQDVMTTDVVTVQAGDSVADAAKAMRDADIGDVIVMRESRIFGILTDRDIVVRVIAEGKDVNQVMAGEVASQNPITASPDTSTDEATSMMKEAAIRRIPVMNSEEVVGIVSIGDLAMESDRESALGEISAAPPNR